MVGPISIDQILKTKGLAGGRVEEGGRGTDGKTDDAADYARSGAGAHNMMGDGRVFARGG